MNKNPDICVLIGALRDLVKVLEFTQRISLKELVEHAEADVSEAHLKNIFGYQQAHKTADEASDAQAREAQAPAQPLAVDNLPATIDFRDFDGHNYVTSIKNQSFCSTCVAFATAAVMETQARIETQIPEGSPDSHKLLDLSEAQLFFCEGDIASLPCATLRSIAPVLQFAQTTGVIPAACFPYPIHGVRDMGYREGCVACDGWEAKVTKINGYRSFANADGTPNQAQMKASLAAGRPLLIGLSGWLDFVAYTSGVYRRSKARWNRELGGHCMACIGYDDEKQAWLCKNCWSTCWGEDGFVWIGYDQPELNFEVWGVDGFDVIYQA